MVPGFVDAVGLDIVLSPDTAGDSIPLPDVLASGLAEHLDLIEQVLPSLIARPVGFAADSARTRAD